MSDSDEIKQQWLSAADAGDVDALARLLEAHPYLLNHRASHQKSWKASSALHLCAWRNNSKAAEFLLMNGADVESRDEAGMTALQIDVLRVCMEKMRPIPLLRSRCIDVSSPIALASFKRKLVKDRSTYNQIDTSTLEVLLRYGASVNARSEIGENALFLAADDGLIKHVRILVEHGADGYHRDRNGKTILDVAGEHGYTDIALLALEHFPDLVKMSGESALRAAVCHDFVAILDILFEKVTSQLPVVRSELLHLAVEYDSPQSALFFIRHATPIDSPNTDGETPVMVACSMGRLNLLELLLDHGANGNCLSPLTGASLYHIALQTHCFPEIEILARYGVNINLFDSNLENPLVYAAKTGMSTDVMELLIAHNANFLFPTAFLRDEFAPILASWIHTLSPERMPALLDHLLRLECVADERCRQVISSLIWSRHTDEALLLLLLVLFPSSPTSAPSRRATALHALMPWCETHGANLVVRKLLMDALDPMAT